MPNGNFVFSERGQRIARLEANRESDIAVNCVIGKMDTKEQAPVSQLMPLL
jgi:hypothetical protein